MFPTDHPIKSSPLPLQDDLASRLLATRAGFDEEGILHQFLVDSYTGGGGFRCGLVPSVEAPFWGRAAYEYGNYATWLVDQPQFNRRRQGPAQQTNSWLTAFYGEDDAEYWDRINNSVYVNFVSPIVGITHAFLMGTDPIREGIPPLLADWSQRVTPLRQSLQDVKKRCTLRGQLVGWCVALMDLPEGPAPTSLAEAEQRGHRPMVSLFWPQQVLDYDLSPKGELLALKVITDFQAPRESLLHPKQQLRRVTCWYPSHWERWTLTLVSGPQTGGGQPQYKVLSRDPETGPNPFGRVPAAIFRWQETVGSDPVRGEPQILSIAHLSRDIYNRMSERRHMLRAQTFGQLVGPDVLSANQGGGQDGGAETGPTNLLLEPIPSGPGSPDGRGVWRYISPDGAPLEAYRTVIDEGKADMFDMAVIDRGTSRVAETAEGRRLRFQRTNAMLASVARNLDYWETEVLRLAGLAYGIPPSVLEGITVHHKDDYSVQQFSDTLEEALKVNDLPMAPEVLAAVVSRVIDECLTNLSAADRQRLKDINERFLVEQAAAKNKAEAAPPAPPPAAPPGEASPAADPPAQAPGEADGESDADE